MSLELKTTLQEIEAVSREWRDFSMQVHGHNTIYYGQNFVVRCYFAEMDYELSAVTIGSNHVNGIQTIFFRRPEIQGFSASDCEQIPEFIAEARRLLEMEKRKHRLCTQARSRVSSIKEVCLQFAEKLASLLERDEQ
jgi:hypothetical protein